MKTSIKRGLKVAIVLGLAALSLTACASSAAPGLVGVVVDDYMIIPTAPVFLDCIAPQTTQTNIFHNNKVYYYPARQISWDATGGTESERGPYVVVSNREAPAELKVPVVVTMDLTTDCEKLKEFHKRLGTKYSAWVSSTEGEDSNTGWVSLLNYAVGQPLETTLTRIAQKYPWQQIWNDEAVRLEFEKTLQAELGDKIKARTDGMEFFMNFQVTVGKPDPVSDPLKTAIADQQTNIAKADAARLAADAQVTQAQAETKVAQQRAIQKRAEISGYPTIDDFLKAQVIAGGGNPYQPTLVGLQPATK